MYCRSWAVSDVGMKRDHNEDSYMADDCMGLFVVADGMGGHLAGETASATAVEVVEQEIRSFFNSSGVEDKCGGTRMMFAASNDSVEKMLKRAMQMASSEVLEKSLENFDLKGMGTTCSLLFFHGGKVWFAHVGDSRIYRVSSDSVMRITTDHSLVQEQLDAGLISREDAETSTLKNIITRSIGFEADVEVDCKQIEWKNGDAFVLCSDGLTNFVTEREIREIVIHKDEETALNFLVRLANQRGGDDNITVIIVRVFDGERPTEEASQKQQEE